jgi:molybdate transport system substrate-binding protein
MTCKAPNKIKPSGDPVKNLTMLRPLPSHLPLLLLLAWLLFLPAAWANDMRLYAAAGVKAPLEELARNYEAASGQHIRLVFDTAGAAEQRFLADGGATFLVTTDTRLHAAEAAGKLRNGMTTAVGATVGGLAIAPGGRRPDISTAEALRDALLAAPRIAFSDPARGATVGRHFMHVIETLGIRDEIMKKATLAADGIETMHLVLEGKADLGITQVSEIMQADPAALLGPFPGQFDLASNYSLWLRADAAPEAKAFAALIGSGAERQRMRKYGLRPPE